MSEQIKTRAELEAAFASGKIPAAADYSNLFSSFVHKNDEPSSGGGSAFPATVYPIEIDISVSDTVHAELANVDDLLSLYQTVGLNNPQIGLIKFNVTSADFNMGNPFFVEILFNNPLIRFVFTDSYSFDIDAEPAFTTPEGAPVVFLAGATNLNTILEIIAISSLYHTVRF